jgi:hypothetical protein
MKGVKYVKETETLKLANYKKGLKKWNLQGRPFTIRFTGSGHSICMMLSSAYCLGEHSADVIKRSANIR